VVRFLQISCKEVCVSLVCRCSLVCCSVLSSSFICIEVNMVRLLCRSIQASQQNLATIMNEFYQNFAGCLGWNGSRQWQIEPLMSDLLTPTPVKAYSTKHYSALHILGMRRAFILTTCFTGHNFGHPS
ncbi:hypothetical protein ABKV19_013716, partial [Rosa sericea]